MSKIDFSKEHQSGVSDETDAPRLNPLDDLCAAAEAYAKDKASAQRKVEDLPAACYRNTSARRMLTLADIHEIARRWTPSRARMDGLLERIDHWGPAHELGHALISTRAERIRYLYGLQRRPWSQQAAHELAAMRVSSVLLTAAGREDLVQAERRWTPMLPETELAGARGAHRRLAWLGVLPRSRVELERALSRRLGSPEGDTAPRKSR